MWELERMLTYYNSEAADAVSYELVDYALRNFCRLPELSLASIAREAYVSKATVSRFVRAFGFDDYAHFIASVSEYLRGSRALSYRLDATSTKTLRHNPDVFLGSYVDDVCQALQDLKRSVSTADVDELLELLTSRDGAALAVDQPLLLAHELQFELLRHGRVLQVGNTARKRGEIAATLGVESFALVLSNYGGFVNDNIALIRDLKERGVTLWLITLCYSSPSTLLFDKVMRLSPRSYSNVGVHPMKVFVEYLVRRLVALGDRI